MAEQDVLVIKTKVQGGNKMSQKGWDQVVRCPFCPGSSYKRMQMNSLVHHTMVAHVTYLVASHTCDGDQGESCLSCGMTAAWQILYGPAAEKRRREQAARIKKRAPSSSASDSDGNVQPDKKKKKKGSGTKKANKRPGRVVVERKGDELVPVSAAVALRARKKNRSIDGSFMSLVESEERMRQAFIHCKTEEEARARAAKYSKGRKGKPMHHDKPHKAGQQPHFHPAGHKLLPFDYKDQGILVNIHVCYPVIQSKNEA